MTLVCLLWPDSNIPLSRIPQRLEGEIGESTCYNGFPNLSDQTFQVPCPFPPFGVKTAVCPCLFLRTRIQGIITSGRSDIHVYISRGHTCQSWREGWALSYQRFKLYYVQKQLWVFNCWDIVIQWSNFLLNLSHKNSRLTAAHMLERYMSTQNSPMLPQCAWKGLS